MKHRRKENTRRASNGTAEHWLGEGTAGQESLIDELDPYLYVADGALCRIVSQLAHRWRDRADRPLALIIPEAEQVPWHIGFLSKKFDVALLTESFDPLVEKAAAHFEAQLLDPRSFGNASGATGERAIDLVLVAAVQHSATDGHLDKALALRDHLSSRARILVCGAADITADLEGVASRIERETTALSSLSAPPQFGIDDFLGRHGDFFGKGARDLCLFRMYRPDFCDAIRSSGTESVTVHDIHVFDDAE